MSAANLGELTELVRIAAKLDAPLDLLHLMWLNRETAEAQIHMMREHLGTQDYTARGFENTLHQFDWQCLVDDLREAIRLAGNLKARLSISRFSKADTVRQWYNTSELVPGYCSFVQTAVRLNAYGKIVPCEFIQYIYGDISSSRFEDIWTGERRQTFIGYFREIGLLPICQRCCKLIVEEG